jgi:hypothetical protein
MSDLSEKLLTSSYYFNYLAKMEGQLNAIKSWIAAKLPVVKGFTESLRAIYIQTSVWWRPRKALDFPSNVTLPVLRFHRAKK